MNFNTKTFSRAKEAEIDQVRTEVESKEEEARRIQEEMEETKRKLEVIPWTDSNELFTWEQRALSMDFTI